MGSFTALPLAQSRKRATLVGTSLAILATSALVVASPSAHAADTEEWSYRVDTVTTANAQGYQSVFDESTRKFYRTEARARSESRSQDPVYDSSGNQIGYTWKYTTTAGAASIIEIDADSHEETKRYDYTGLSRLDGGAESSAFDWTGVSSNSQNSMRTHFSPNGIAVDSATTTDGQVDPTFITTHVRQRLSNEPGADSSLNYGGGIVVFKQSEGAPGDEDRIWKFDMGTPSDNSDDVPVLDNARQIAVNTQTHTAFIASMGAKNGNASRPGSIAVIDLEAKDVLARVGLPLRDGALDQTTGLGLASAQNYGAIDVTVDEENNIAYAGTIVSNGGNGLYKTPIIAIDLDGLNTSDPVSYSLNSDKVSVLGGIDSATGFANTLVTHNARPYYDAETKRLYVASYSNQAVSGVPNGQITAIDADPASATYGSTVASTQVNGINAVTVDADRGLVYGADNITGSVRVYDADTLEEYLAVPVSGRANDVGVDPETGEVWLGTFSFGGTDASTSSVIRVFEPGKTVAGNGAATIEVSDSTSVAGKASNVTVVVLDSKGRSATGAVTLTGAGDPVTATLKRGEATFSIPTTLAAGTYPLTFTYGGDADLRETVATTTHTIAKQAAKLKAKVAKAPTTTKAGKLKVTVPSGLTGAVKVVLTKGKSKVNASAKIKGTVATVKVPKLAKGTWTATVTSKANASFEAGSTSVKIKVKS